MTEERGVREVVEVRYRDPATGEMVTRDIRDLPPGFANGPRAPGDERTVTVTHHEAPAMTKEEQMKDKAGQMIWTSIWPLAPGDGKRIPAAQRLILDAIVALDAGNMDLADHLLERAEAAIEDGKRTISETRARISAIRARKDPTLPEPLGGGLSRSLDGTISGTPSENVTITWKKETEE